MAGDGVKRKLGQMLLAGAFLLPAFALELSLLAAVASVCNSCKAGALR